MSSYFIRDTHTFVKIADDSIMESDNIKKIDDSVMEQYYDVSRLIDDISNSTVIFYPTPHKIEDYFIDVNIPSAIKIDDNTFSLTQYIGNTYTCILSLTDGREFDYSIINNHYSLIINNYGSVLSPTNDFSFIYAFYAEDSKQSVEINMDDRKIIEFKTPTYDLYIDHIYFKAIKIGTKLCQKEIQLRLNLSSKEF